jgi:hypothetical protein
MDIGPVAEPGITNACNCAPLLDVTIAVTPPILKEVGLPRLAPFTIIKVPAGPDAGLNEVIAGDCAKVAVASVIKSKQSSDLDFINIPLNKLY